jgi:aspartyl-tRNA(Asn)/glutamyl-tRNA(Gln) amidotransferase subunit B
VAASDKSPSALAGWVTGPLFGLANARGEGLDTASGRVPPAALADLVARVDAGELSAGAARTVLEKMYHGGEGAGAIVEREGLGLIADAGELAAVVAQVLADNPKAVADYHGGKGTALGFLVGGVMKATRGQADPNVARALLVSALEETPATPAGARPFDPQNHQPSTGGGETG